MSGLRKHLLGQGWAPRDQARSVSFALTIEPQPGYRVRVQLTSCERPDDGTWLRLATVDEVELPGRGPNDRTAAGWERWIDARVRVAPAAFPPGTRRQREHRGSLVVLRWHVDVNAEEGP